MSLEENFYLNRYQFTDKLIGESPSKRLGIVVVIPCYKEPDLIGALKALNECDLPDCDVEIITIINSAENVATEIKELNLTSYKEAQDFASNFGTPERKYHTILKDDLPQKHAGVGLARKIGMDEAVRRLELVNNSEGVILCFDADSKCSKNLLTEVHNAFLDDITGCSIHYEHPLEGKLSTSNYDAIINYELHLRYYVQIQKWAGFIHAHQTIGSSMAVRSSVYQKQGGMNRRKAGEDFYFLHKIIPLGNFRDLNTTHTIPSLRVSDRVPFGTGKAVGDYLSKSTGAYKTYNPKSFTALKILFDRVPTLYTLDIIYFPDELKSFLTTVKFEEQIVEIRRQSKSLETFINRFYRWFNGFMIMKYTHFMRDYFYPNVLITEAVQTFLQLSKIEHNCTTEKDFLLLLRSIDKGS